MVGQEGGGQIRGRERLQVGRGLGPTGSWIAHVGLPTCKAGGERHTGPWPRAAVEGRDPPGLHAWRSIRWPWPEGRFLEMRRERGTAYERASARAGYRAKGGLYGGCKSGRINPPSRQRLGQAREAIEDHVQGGSSCTKHHVMKPANIEFAIILLDWVYVIHSWFVFFVEFAINLIYVSSFAVSPSDLGEQFSKIKQDRTMRKWFARQSSTTELHPMPKESSSIKQVAALPLNQMKLWIRAHMTSLKILAK
ncbi:hypothetical protein GOP47_0016608 [Adiantum capillus-veneris]|uniref:Uncharacterized protein n=1 Tax=Adiantum capillus-veneris TaxID=13818 RepID=A0A9D4UHZ8_ADICA|nr:hypothetical protein GOP47_0016608 [Adiantum capillus-veneris]